MYKLLLAEDQPEVLNGILTTVPWQRHGFETPLGCRDGRDAIAAIENGFKPNAVITDICMPFADGLKLTRYIAEHLPRTLVVVLSGYDEFTYAQQALKLGVYDYVLKPVTPGKMDEFLSSISRALDAKRMNDIDDSMQILLGHFLNRLVSKTHHDEQVEENLKRYQLTMNGSSFYAAVIDIDNPGDIQGPNAEGHSDLMRYALFNMASELMDLPDKALVFQGVDGTTRVLFAIGPDDDPNLPEQMLSLVCQTFREHMPCTVSAGLGAPVSRLGAACESHRSACEALGYRFFMGEGSVISYTGLVRRVSSDLDLTEEYAAFEEALRAFSETRVTESLTAIFTRLRESHCALNRCVLCCQRLIVSLHEFASQFGGPTEKHAFMRIWENMDLSSAHTLLHLENQMHELCREMPGLFSYEQSGSAAAVIGRAEEYICARYGDPELSLQTVTEHLAVSVSYFSANFKARTGATFVEYLTRVRMEKAKHLLALSDLRTYETAQMVGFSDPHYFSVAFKRYTGMSPREFREYSAKH